MIIDVHSHVLPGMDDGCKHAAESIEVLQMMKKQGVELVCATPHFYCWNEDVESFLDRREYSWSRLLEELEKVDPLSIPKVWLGAEVAFADALEGMEGLEKLTFINPTIKERKKALLLEMPFRQWTSAETGLVRKLSIDGGYEVILAHIERYMRFQNNSHAFDEILSLPVHVQINAETIIPFFGRKQWFQMLRDGSAHFIASDAHNLTNRRPLIGEARNILVSKLGEEKLTELDKKGYSIINQNRD